MNKKYGAYVCNNNTIMNENIISDNKINDRQNQLDLFMYINIGYLNKKSYFNNYAVAYFENHCDYVGETKLKDIQNIINNKNMINLYEYDFNKLKELIPDIEYEDYIDRLDFANKQFDLNNNMTYFGILSKYYAYNILGVSFAIFAIFAIYTFSIR